MKRVNSKGETVVEVLLAIAAVAGVLASAYYLINRSYKQSLDATERVAATKAAESKIEVLRAKYSADLAVNGSEFCLKDDGTRVDVSADSSCSVGIYKVTLTNKGTPASPIFESKATWDGLQAGQTSTIYYKP